MAPTTKVGTMFSRPLGVQPLNQQAVDALEATRQLVATAAAFTLVVLQVIGLERQGALARLQHQSSAGWQYGQVGEVFLAAGDALTGGCR